MPDAFESAIVLLSSALVKPPENATGGDLDGIYSHGRVPLQPHQQAGRGRICEALARG